MRVKLSLKNSRLNMLLLNNLLLLNFKDSFYKLLVKSKDLFYYAHKDFIGVRFINNYSYFSAFISQINGYLNN